MKNDFSYLSCKLDQIGREEKSGIDLIRNDKILIIFLVIFFKNCKHVQFIDQLIFFFVEF